MKNFIAAVAALALLAACEAKIGKHEGEADTGAGGNVSADGKSKDGQFSIKAPGFDMKVDIPDSVASRANFDDDSEIIYPGAQLSGIHIEGARHKGGVEIRFSSADPADKVAAWYRDGARAGDFTVDSATREGEGYVIAGAQKDDGDPFTLHLGPRDGGGTEGRLVLSDRG